MPKCSKCNGTGLVPSKVLGVFSGKLIPDCFTACECKQEEHEYLRQVKPSDFDFPMSYSYYRSLCQLHGWSDPGDDRMPEPETPTPQEVIHRHSEMGKKEFDLLQQTARKVQYLQDRHNLHLDPPLKRGGIKI